MDKDWLTAFEALKSVYSDGAFSNIALNEAIPRHRGCRESFVRTLVKGTIRYTKTLDYIVDRLAKGGVAKVRVRTLIILRMGLYAIRSMDSVPDHAAVSEAVALAKKTARGTDGFINAVLRSYLRQRDGIEASIGASVPLRYSFPEEITGMISEQYGDEAAPILEALNTPPPLVLRVNTLRTTADELAAKLAAEGIETRRPDSGAEDARETDRVLIAESGGALATSLYRDGLFTVQSLSSILAVEALAPAPGSKVLDMCAAPGGKSTLMAELMENRGSITACDIHEHRLQLIEASAARLGIDIIETRLMDGTVHDSSLEGQFDYVLADVPCSGLGVIGSKPELRYRADVSTFPGLTDIQLAILKNAVSYVRPGGVVEYSTCTLNKDENDAVIERLMAELTRGKCSRATGQSAGTYEQGSRAAASDARDTAVSGGLDALKTVSSLSIVEKRTLLPYNDRVGFYYCLLIRDA